MSIFGVIVVRSYFAFRLNTEIFRENADENNSEYGHFLYSDNQKDELEMLKSFNQKYYG